MMAANSDNHYDEILRRLQADMESIPWPERREIAASLAEPLTAGQKSDSAMALVFLLSDDPKPEVRTEIAALLVYLPEEDFLSMFGKYSGDSHVYVRKAAEQSRERRRKAELEAKKASRGIEQVFQQYESLAKQAGEKIANKAISLSEKRFALLAKAMVHDLLNLLTPLKSRTQTLAQRLAGENTALHQQATLLSEDLNFLEQSIRDVEAYAQALPHERHSELVHEVVRQALELARRNLEEQGLDLSAVMLDDAVISEMRVEMSRQLVVQALTNILTNAYEAFLGRGGKLDNGRIVLSARQADGYATIEIRDNGCGLSSEELASLRAFLPGRKNMNKKRSTGYGLLIAKKNIEAHDGTLTVESSLDKGTAVTVTLPLNARGE